MEKKQLPSGYSNEEPSQQSNTLNFGQELNTNKQNCSEIIARKPYNKFMDMVNHDGKYFLALGVNKISEEKDSEEELEVHIAMDELEIMFRMCVTILEVHNKLNKN